MTPLEKIILLNKHGRKWGEIANILGVSRQFLTRVRSGTKNLSTRKLEILDGLVSVYDTQDGNPDGNHPVVKESSSCYDGGSEIQKLMEDVEALKLDVALLKRLVLKEKG